MNESVYFYASTEENLMLIPEGSQVYDNFTKCKKVVRINE